MRPTAYFARRAAFVPVGVIFALGAGMSILGVAMAISHLPWELTGRVDKCEVIDKYISPPTESTKNVVDSRLGCRPVGSELNVDLPYEVYRGWEKVQVGDAIDVEYLPNGAGRIPGSQGSVQLGAGLAVIGLVFLAISGIPILLMGRDEQRAGRLDPRVLWDQLNDQILSNARRRARRRDRERP